VDLRETINQPKSPEVSPWKSFHGTLFNTLYLQHLQLSLSKTDQAEIWGGPPKPYKIKLIQF
jgi:hypothetical protein